MPRSFRYFMWLVLIVAALVVVRLRSLPHEYPAEAECLAQSRQGAKEEGDTFAIRSSSLAGRANQAGLPTGPIALLDEIAVDQVYPGAILGAMKTTLQRWGNSQGVRLPKSIVESLGIAVGASVIVEISKDNSQVTITPATASHSVRGRHRIEDLIAKSSPKAFDGACNWGKAVGKEAW